MRKFEESPERKLELANRSVFDSFYKSKGWQPDRSKDGFNYDLMLWRDGNSYRTDEKVRLVDYGDFLVEVIQDVFEENRGWLYKVWGYKKEGYEIIMYYVKPANKIYEVHWLRFTSWLKDEYRTIPKIGSNVSKEGWGLTINLTLKWAYIPSSLYIIHDVPSK